MRATAEAAGDVVSVIVLKGTQAGVEQLSLGHDDHVEPRRDLVPTEDLSNQSFSSISVDCSAELACGSDTESGDGERVRQREQGRETAVDLRPVLINALELRSLANALHGPETSVLTHKGDQSGGVVRRREPASGAYAPLTVRRFLPLARRRFNTRRPFFVLIRTRNPCAFRRLRTFG